MKTIEISDEKYEFLQSLANELSTQDNRATQDVGFMVYHKVRERVHQDCDRDERERKDYYFEWDLCDKCSELYDNDDDLPEDCKDCCGGAFDHYKLEWKLDDRAWVFLTAKACDKHIEENYYHYWEWAKSYWIHFRRNYEMVDLIWCIFDITKVKKPDHYS